MQYFYEQKETSERVFRWHHNMNLVWQYTTYAAFVVFIYAVYFHTSQNKEIWDSAKDLVARDKREGGKTQVKQDGSVDLIIEGKLIANIDQKSDQSINKDS